MYAEGQTLKITATPNNPFYKVLGERTLTVTVLEIDINGDIAIELSETDAAQTVGLIKPGRRTTTIMLDHGGPVTYMPKWTITEDEESESTMHQGLEYAGVPNVASASDALALLLCNGAPYRPTQYDMQRLATCLYLNSGFDGDPDTHPLTIKMLAKGYIAENPKHRAYEEECAAKIAALNAVRPGNYSIGVGSPYSRWIATESGAVFIRHLVGDDQPEAQPPALIGKAKTATTTTESIPLSGIERIEPQDANDKKTPVDLARDANDMIDFIWGHTKAVEYFNQLDDPDRRLVQANRWLSSLLEKGYTRAGAQLIVLSLIKRLHNEGTSKVWISNSSEEICSRLVSRLSAFKGAQPLTDKQFATAVKAAW